MVASKAEYSPLAGEDGQNAACPWCQHRSIEDSRRPWNRLTILITLCTAVSTFIMGTTLGIWIQQHDKSTSSQASIYSTDFSPARPAVELEQVRFTGTAKFDSSGHAYVEPQEIRYVGNPEDGSVDKAWKNLIHHRYFYITDDEAREAWGENYTQYWKKPGYGYRAGLDVLHTLHCVDVLRKVIYKDHYGNMHHDHEGEKVRKRRNIAGFEEYHIDHCLDIVRQNIQCHGDLTLIPTRWFDGIGRQFIDSNQVHTCRNFDKIRSFAFERWSNSLNGVDGMSPDDVDEEH